MRKVVGVLLAICIVLFGWWMISRIVSSISFNFNCETYLKRAADSSTVELAKENLAVAIEYAEENELTEGIVSIFFKNPKNDVGFWYKNMKAAYEELDSLPEDATDLEKTNMLMKLRESLVDSAEDCISVTHPEGISIYPDNVLYFWWGLLSFIAGLFFFVLFAAMDD